MYSKNDIENFFSQTIDTNRELNSRNLLSWGYYFRNNQINTLEEAKQILISNGYSFAEIILEDDEYYLQIEKIESHTIDSLYDRCLELNTLAQRLQINSFDGFDVEAVRTA